MKFLMVFIKFLLIAKFVASSTENCKTCVKNGMFWCSRNDGGSCEHFKISNLKCDEVLDKELDCMDKKKQQKPKIQFITEECNLQIIRQLFSNHTSSMELMMATDYRILREGLIHFKDLKSGLQRLEQLHRKDYCIDVLSAVGDLKKEIIIHLNFQNVTNSDKEDKEVLAETNFIWKLNSPVPFFVVLACLIMIMALEICVLINGGIANYRIRALQIRIVELGEAINRALQPAEGIIPNQDDGYEHIQLHQIL